MEQLTLLKDTDFRNHFLSNFDWTNSTFKIEAKQAVEALLVDFCAIYPRHRFHIEINRVQSTPHTFRKQACLQPETSSAS